MHALLKSLSFYSLFLTYPLFAQTSEEIISKYEIGKTPPTSKMISANSVKNEPSKMDVSLQQIVLVDSADKVGGQDSSEEVVVFKDFSPPSKNSLAERLNVYIGEPISIELLDEIRDTIVKFYHDHGYPLVGVSAPAGQNISLGNVYILVLVGKLGSVKAYGAKWFSNEWIAKQISLKPGDKFRTGPLLDDMAWLNRNPFRSVELIYEKGPSLGQTDIVLDTKDRFPVRVFGGYQNTGNIIAGDSRWTTGLNAGNLWGIDHLINFQFVTAAPAKQWWAVSGNYVAPLPSRDVFKLLGNYIKTKPKHLEDLQGNGPESSVGKQWEMAGRYRVQLPTLGSWRHVFEIGYDYKRTNNFLSVSPTLVFQNAVEISQFSLGYESDWEGKSGSVFFQIAAFLSPGRMLPKNKDKYFNAERPGAKANYAYYRASIDYIRMLPKKFSWMLSTLLQYAPQKLLPTEEISLGGFSSIRGYEENEIVSDRGIIIKNEFRAPSISFRKDKLDGLQFLVFADFGIANNVDEQIYNRDNVMLAAVGPGVRYDIPEYLSFFFDWGIQLHYIHNRPFVDNQRGRLHTGVTVGF